MKLARRDDKDKILEDYLNTIYFGRGAYGIETAAQTYFGKAAKDLTVERGRGPRLGDPVAGQLRPGRRRRAVAGPLRLRARRHGHQGLAADAGERAGMQVPKTGRPEEAQGRHRLLPAGHRPARAQGAAASATRTSTSAACGSRRPSTARSQRAAVRAVRQERPRENARNVHIGLSAVQPGTGAVVAMYGGSEAGQLNEATQARVQPGSAFKPFALSGGAARRHQPARAGSTATRRSTLPGTDKEVNNEFDNDYGTVGRPGQGHRGLHQHGVTST